MQVATEFRQALDEQVEEKRRRQALEREREIEEQRALQQQLEQQYVCAVRAPHVVRGLCLLALTLSCLCCPGAGAYPCARSPRRMSLERTRREHARRLSSSHLRDEWRRQSMLRTISADIQFKLTGYR